MASPASGPSTSILYHNEARTVFLLDIPSSLALAQHSSEEINGGQILRLCQPFSHPPLQRPHAVNEPQGNKRELVLSQQKLIDISVDLLHDALDQIRAEVSNQSWCRPRLVWGEAQLEEKRSKDVSTFSSSGLVRGWSDMELIILPPEGITVQSYSDIEGHVISNERKQPSCIEIKSTSAKFQVPPLSTFISSRIDHNTCLRFSMAALQKYPSPSDSTAAGPGEFDIVILDPPWANRSARRSRQYAPPTRTDDPVDILGSILGQHIASGAFVFMWITTKSSIRQKAIDIFEDWHVDLVQQWLWLKITARGEPIVSVDNAWRRPYEILLVGQKRKNADGQARKRTPLRAQEITRYIAAVPDVHSRKPILKQFIETELLTEVKSYRALELFARSLTAEWWAWGDETLKFNDVQSWTP